MSASYRELRLEERGEVLELVLCRPETRNAMSEAMGHELVAAVTEINRRPETRVVVVRGEGKVFAAGGDFDFIAARCAGEAEANRTTMLDYYRLFLTIREVRVPTIAAMHGAAIGAGLCFALACDLRIAAEGTVFGFNFVRLGLHPGMGATHFLPQLIGPARAAELLLTGRRFGAERALALGLLSSLHAPEELIAASRELAAEIASCAPLAVARTKATLQHSFQRDLPQSLLAEASAQALDFPTADMSEGLLAAKERREARFRGA